LAIDIGTAAIDRDSAQNIKDYTMVEGSNPANADGTIDTGEIWLYNKSGSVDIYFGTFSASGNVLTCRDSESVGDVVTGSKQTFTGLTIAVVTGDYLGTTSKNPWGANIEGDVSGGVGRWYKVGEYIDPNDSATFTWGAGVILSLYGTGTEGGGATEKFGADTGVGADARASGNPAAAINGGEAGSGADALPFREIALPDSGSGADAFVSLQTPAAKTASDTGAGVDALVSLQVPAAKTASDNGSGVEAVPIPGAILAGSESGSGVEAFIARLLAAAETGCGAEASEIGGGGLLKHLFASELGEGADGLTAKIEKPTKGGGMRLWT